MIRGFPGDYKTFDQNILHPKKNSFIDSNRRRQLLPT